MKPTEMFRNLTEENCRFRIVSTVHLSELQSEIENRAKPRPIRQRIRPDVPFQLQVHASRRTQRRQIRHRGRYAECQLPKPSSTGKEKKGALSSCRQHTPPTTKNACGLSIWWRKPWARKDTGLLLKAPVEAARVPKRHSRVRKKQH